MTTDRPEPTDADVRQWGADMQHITCEELRVRLAAGDAPGARGAVGTVVDVRTPGEWNRRHIPGATLVPLHEFGERIAELLALPGPLLVHCEHGVRSRQAVLFLRWHGRADVCNVVEGLCAWRGPVESGRPAS